MDKIVWYGGKLELLSKLRRWLRCRRCGCGVTVDDGRVFCQRCGRADALYERPSGSAEAEC